MNKTWQEIEASFRMGLSSLYPEQEIRQIFLLALEHISSTKPSQYLLVRNSGVSASNVDALYQILQQLQTGRPIQHILGYAHFYGNVFEVSEHTLIPRPETEELVHLIIQDQRLHSASSCIDIGTGTGCIPITLAHHMPQLSYWAVDISHEALNIAKRNAQKIQTPIRFMQIDILEWDLVFPNDLKFDIIVSNPPYITQTEKTEMHQNVLAFEPHTALFVEDNAPLLFYDYIADFAKVHLNPTGQLYFEINQYLSNETADLLQKKGFQNVQIYKDINGADRIIKAQLD